ncbi:peptidase inhibitor 16-like [Acanthochromis polyacanthus]|uniref:peptidase inhibitor 16-like n=1 Tax=Acanthochromis polyacanthus TaxID=80966 RepID=UPI000B90184E|nr:peptidase inhibitor 16-like [Acanthochromis polyacanthus]
MHQRSFSELQGVTTQRGASTPRTSQNGASWSSRLRESGRCRCPPRGATLWTWLLLGALVLPGAWSFLSEEQEELVVELHNYYRGQVQPSASAMLPLKWDSNLKLLAEGYAAKCVWNHNPELEDTGENLFAGTGPLDLRVALEKWFLERLDYDFHNNSCDEDKMCGHYTQMVWADTHRVGCAFHICNSMEELDWERVSFLVCNYYPAGNYENERPYVEGDWCSRCPENLQKCENNLCAPERVEEDAEDEGVEESEHEATPDPSLQPPETNPPGTFDLPDTTDSDTSIMPTLFSWFSTDIPVTATTAKVPETQSATVGKDEEVEERVEEDEKVEPEKRKETTARKAAEREVGVTRIIHQNTGASMNAASVSLPPVLLACLTAMLTLRL